MVAQSSLTLPASAFEQFSLCSELNQALIDLEFTEPTQIQLEAIPPLLASNDVLGQAQTGTGKTAAFGLPLLSLIHWKQKKPQALILVPTRELAIQVSRAISDFAKYIKEIKVIAIYGGDSYYHQIRALKEGAQIIVSTPGRMMDHMRRKTVEFNTIEKVVLDEADEMLNMGFLDDVEWILDQLPARAHTALFSATMPKVIRKVAFKYLDKNNTKEIVIAPSKQQTSTIEQRYIITPNRNKLMVLTRVLEVEKSESIIIFARTKSLTEEISDKLSQLNFSVSALNGDMPQDLRKKIMDKVRKGSIKILVATDVAARGLDIEQISHVINYDAPHDVETYIHRIGRTGRAGRDGTAILFLTPAEKRMLRAIENKVHRSIEEMHVPSDKAINEFKVNRFKARISAVLNGKESQDEQDNQATSIFYTMLQELKKEHAVEDLELATALALLSHKERPILLEHKDKFKNKEHSFSDNQNSKKKFGDKFSKHDSRSRSRTTERSRRGRNDPRTMEDYRLEVGKDHGVKPRNIVGAIANEGGLSSQSIDNIRIFDDHSTISLPKNMPPHVFKILKKIWVCGQKLDISRI